MDYLLHNAEGRILQTGSGDEIAVNAQGDSESILLVTDLSAGQSHDTHYVLNGNLTDRPSLGATVSGSVISNIPAGTEVIINPGNTVETVNDGSVDLSSSSVGTYSVILINFPHKDLFLEVTV